MQSRVRTGAHFHALAQTSHLFDRSVTAAVRIYVNGDSIRIFCGANSSQRSTDVFFFIVRKDTDANRRFRIQNHVIRHLKDLLHFQQHAVDLFVVRGDPGG